LINLGFLLREKLAAVLIIPSLRVPNWSVIYINTAPQSSLFLALLPAVAVCDSVNHHPVGNPKRKV
jgi:hypothetical protein